MRGEQPFLALGLQSPVLTGILQREGTSALKKGMKSKMKLSGRLDYVGNRPR